MSTSRKSRLPFGRLVLVTAGMLIALLVTLSPAQAETGKKALILGPTVSGGMSSAEATRAVADGFTVDVVDAATWGAMTAAQFADYQMIVVGDPTCGSLPAVVSENATALADAVMARAGGNSKAGNRILIGTDPVFHFAQGGSALINAAIDFAGVQEGASGLYLDFTCGDIDWDSNGTPDGQDKLLPLLTADPSGAWAQNQSPPCGGDVSLISNADQFATLTSAQLRGWSCSVHETFPTFPTDWSALAIATDTTSAPTCGNDVDTGTAQCGEAYLLIAGTGIVSTAPDLSLDPTTATNPVGTEHTVTATVTNTDDSPRSGVLVSWVVTGANAGASGTCVPADCTSGADGKVSFTYTGANEGDDTINASITVDGSRQTATASKTWTAGEEGVPSMSLDPATGTNPVGSEHTVTATVLGGDDSPASGVLVSFAVTGANAGATGACAPADCMTGADGNVSFTYTGANDGDDTITASATVGETNLTATAAKTWTAVVDHGTGSITIVKSTFGHSSGSTVFPFVLTGHAYHAAFDLDTNPHTTTPDRWTFADLPAGAYTVAEVVPHGWELHRIACVDPDHGTTLDSVHAAANIDLDAGESIVCTFYDVPLHH